MAINPRRYDIDLMNEIFTKSKVFIDTSSLMDEHYPDFEQLLFPTLRSKNAYIIIPQRVINELNKLSNNIDEKKSNAAKYAIDSIDKNKQFINIESENEYNFTRDVFLQQFTILHMEYNLTLITQNIGLAHDIININKSTNQNSTYMINVYRITKWGTLGLNDGDIGRKNKLDQTGRYSVDDNYSDNQNITKHNKKYIFIIIIIITIFSILFIKNYSINNITSSNYQKVYSKIEAKTSFAEKLPSVGSEWSKNCIGV